MIVAVILHHNKPENADKLYEQLDGVFDRVELWDSGSDSDKIPINVTESFDNIYWAGAWNEIMSRYSDYDAVWMLGCDVTLQSEPEAYLAAIRASGDFGCWSPCVSGRAHPFMKAENYSHDQPKSVRNVEGMAMAVSGKLMREVGKLVEGGTIGFGQDYWLCYRARKLGLLNIIDGRVSIYHPAEIGYDEKAAHDEMEQVFGQLFGDDFRHTIFEYDETYEGNLVDKPAPVVRNGGEMLTIVTADNGWGVDEFLRITDGMPVNRILLQKGSSSLGHLESQGVKVIPYNRPEDALEVIQGDIALFPKVGPANEKEYRLLVESGIPTVVQVNHAKGAIEHEKTGFLFGTEEWAKIWLNRLIDEPELRESVRGNLRAVPEREENVTVQEDVPVETTPEPPNVPEREIPSSFDEGMADFDEGKTVPMETALNESPEPIVTVITPTYKRDLKMVRRCIEVMQLQYEQNWEQLICSNGLEEPEVRKLVEEIGDSRVGYHWCEAPVGDYGNYARKEMLKVARGRYVLMFDDDNYIMPEYLRLMIETLESSRADFAVCRVMHFGPLNEKVRGKPPVILGTNKLEVYHIDILQFLMRRDAIIEIGWDEKNGYISEVSLERLAKRYRGVEIPLVLGVHI